MKCEEAEELIGAYAVGALTDDEERAMHEHIAGCETHAEEARDLTAVASRLNALADPVTPPPALRSRVLDAIAGDGATRADATVAAPRSIERARESRGRVMWSPRAEGSRFSYAWGALAAAVIFAIGGLIAWNVVLMNRLDDRDDAARFASRATSVSTLRTQDGASMGTVVVFGDEGKAAIFADGIQQPAAGRTYQMWVIHDDQPVSLGTMKPDADGHVSRVIAIDGARGDSFALTVEPEGGSAQPTSAPVLVADL